MPESDHSNHVGFPSTSPSADGDAGGTVRFCLRAFFGGKVEGEVSEMSILWILILLLNLDSEM
jgi:hypothetical protein